MISAIVGNKRTPLFLGMKAMNTITRKYGSLLGFQNVLKNTEDPDAQNEAIFFVAHAMNINAAVMEKSSHSFDNAEEMEAFCMPHEYLPLFTAVTDAIKESTQVTVEAEVAGDNSKNT